MPGSVPTPRDEYSRRLGARQATADQLTHQDATIANLRLLVFLGAIGLAYLAYAWASVSAWWMLAPVGGFVALIMWHERTLQAKARAEGAVAYYIRALDRLDGRWAGTGITDSSFAPEEHPYAADLDLFGTGSLFDLLCTARTRAGQQTLAQWLCEPATRPVVEARQAVVDELRAELDLREDLALMGGDVRTRVHPAILKAWGEAPIELGGRRARLFAGAVSALGYLSGGLAFFAYPHPATIVGLIGFGAAILLVIGLHWTVSKRVHAVITALEAPRRELDILAGVLERLESETFDSADLRALQAELQTGDLPASMAIRRLERLATLLEARMNQLFAPFAALLLWDFQCAAAIEAWRAQFGHDISRWLKAVGTMEALCALAAYAYEHPADPFPTLETEGPLFDGAHLGHPLLPESTCVRNDVRLDGTRQLLLVSGSNMSGKSTLLRTVGINVVLALAGAPVRAARLRLSPLAVGASIRTIDSLQGGTSRFYAEIRRLRGIMDLTSGPHPTLFLLDELLHGTNSHDRSIGAAGIVRGFLDAGAIGLVTTHDLSLTAMATQLAERAANVHFADTLDDGKLHFDYRLRAGVVQHSNALALMRAIGLDV